MGGKALSHDSVFVSDSSEANEALGASQDSIHGKVKSLQTTETHSKKNPSSTSPNTDSIKDGCCCCDVTDETTVFNAF
uniref:Uncharacterized protein n=1 Tax=Amphilophus citrinellus TaxID=61819 RepID=A0A3Q0T0L8_AMPCI